jgi:hypothetical protein
MSDDGNMLAAGYPCDLWAVSTQGFCITLLSEKTGDVTKSIFTNSSISSGYAYAKFTFAPDGNSLWFISQEINNKTNQYIGQYSFSTGLIYTWVYFE